VNTIIEIARFRVAKEHEEAFLEARPAMVEAAFRGLPGLRRLELVRLDSGEWLDVVVWDDGESAARAPALAGSIPEFAAWMSQIAEDTGMDYGEVVDSTQAA
jgi:quinol monooxygenase YgiN